MWLIRGNSLLLLVVIVLNLTIARQESTLTNQLFIDEQDRSHCLLLLPARDGQFSRIDNRPL